MLFKQKALILFWKQLLSSKQPITGVKAYVIAEVQYKTHTYIYQAIICKLDKINQVLLLRGGKRLIEFFLDTIKNENYYAKHCFISWVNRVKEVFFNEKNSITEFEIKPQLVNITESRIRTA